MKVRVIKEMPFSEIGKYFDVSPEGFIVSRIAGAYPCAYYFKIHAETAIQDGWLEEVKEEKRLSDKLHEELYKYIGTSGCNVVADIATKHFEERFDKADCIYCHKCGEPVDPRDLKEALFGKD